MVVSSLVLCNVRFSRTDKSYKHASLLFNRSGLSKSSAAMRLVRHSVRDSVIASASRSRRPRGTTGSSGASLASQFLRRFRWAVKPDAPSNWRRPGRPSWQRSRAGRLPTRYISRRFWLSNERSNWAPFRSIAQATLSKPIADRAEESRVAATVLSQSRVLRAAATSVLHVTRAQW